MMSGIGETMTYLEGRIAAMECICAVLMKSIPIIGASTVIEEALRELPKTVSPQSEPGFQRGFAEGIQRVIDTAGKLQKGQQAP